MAGSQLVSPWNHFCFKIIITAIRAALASENTACYIRLRFRFVFVLVRTKRSLSCGNFCVSFGSIGCTFDCLCKLTQTVWKEIANYGSFIQLISQSPIPSIHPFVHFLAPPENPAVTVQWHETIRDSRGAWPLGQYRSRGCLKRQR